MSNQTLSQPIASAKTNMAVRIVIGLTLSFASGPMLTAAFAAIGKTMPSYWAMNGYQNILLRGLGLESVLTAVGMLSAYAVFFFLLAVWRFRKMEA